MVTAHGREGASQAAHGLDVAGFLTKPVTSSTLLDALMVATGGELSVDTRAAGRQEEMARAAARLRGARVLLVEDNEINQELAMELLVSNGLSVQVANHGREALELLEQASFDGVLMDCQMPVMDGYTATREIRRREKFRGLPVLAMTANAMAGDREKALAAGMNDHIAKPINVRELFVTMSKWIKPSEFAEANSESVGGVGLSPSAGDDEGIPELAGIDRQAGLARTQGNSRLYRKLLIGFRDSQRDFEAEFRAAQAADDPQAAIRCAHTLKGVAGNIGAQGIQTAAEALEQGCREGVEDIEARLERVLDELEPVMSSLGGLEQPVARPTSGGELDRSRIQALLTRLRELLEEDDSEATDLMEELVPLMAGSGHAEKLARLADQVAEYSFEEALVALEDLERAL
jgi:polar amino acid transport system substrate-binding protein